MATQQLPQDLRRAGLALEATFGSSTGIGSVVNLPGLTTAAITPARADVPRPVVLNAERDTYADLPGFKTGSAEISALLGADLATSWGGPLKTSLGAEVSAVTLPSVSSGNQSTVTMSSSTTFDKILKIPGSDSKTRLVPVKSSTSTVATFAVLLPSGVTASDAQNASESGGKAWVDDPDGAVDSWHLYTDDGGNSLQTRTALKGAVPTGISLVYDPTGLMQISTSWQGATWATGGSGVLSDAAAPGEPYHSALCDCYLQDLGTPVAGEPLPVKSLSLRIGYDFSMQSHTPGVDGAATLPETATVGATRGRSAEDLIEVVIEDPDWDDWDDLRASQTPLLFFVAWYSGTPGESAGATSLGYYAPQVKIVAASRTEVDGVACTRLSLKRERSLSPAHAREYLSFFGNS